MFIVFSTLNYENKELYDSWNFPSAAEFDQFWFDDRNTTFLYHSDSYVIGKDQIDIARIRVTPEILIKKNRKPKMVILGLTLSYSDTELKNLNYDSVLNKNQDARVPHALVFNSSDIYSGFQADYTERIYIYKYFGFSDIMAGIGGTNAFIKPILNSVVPYFVIFFLYSLSCILLFKYTQSYNKEAVVFLEFSSKLLHHRVAD